MRTSRASTVGAGATFLLAIGLAAAALTTGQDQGTSGTGTTAPALRPSAAAAPSEPSGAEARTAGAAAAPATTDGTTEADLTDFSETAAATVSVPKAGGTAPTASAVAPAAPTAQPTAVSQPTPSPTPATPPVSRSEPPATPATPTIPPGATGEDCGRVTPAGWPTTTASDPRVADCLLRNLRAGTPATVTEVSYDGGNTLGPEYRHVITYRVIAQGLIEKTTDWRGATAGPVGTVTVEHCTSLDGPYFPFAVSGCSPA